MKDERVYLRHILRCITRVEEYTVDGRERFFASELHQDAVIRNLQTLAESSRQLDEAAKARHPDVDWKGLAGFRNVLVHDYLGVDLELVYRAVEHDVPRLKAACELLLAEAGVEEEES